MLFSHRLAGPLSRRQTSAVYNCTHADGQWSIAKQHGRRCRCSHLSEVAIKANTPTGVESGDGGGAIFQAVKSTSQFTVDAKADYDGGICTSHLDRGCSPPCWLGSTHASVSNTEYASQKTCLSLRYLLNQSWVFCLGPSRSTISPVTPVISTR